jgi:phosphatidylserine/phosphatidylglycerophosphate/cardiolipin synthase-like enzyme
MGVMNKMIPIFISLIIGIGIGYVVSLDRISELRDEVRSLESEISVLTAKLERMAGYEVYVLNDREYYHSIKRDIENADKTISVAMCSMIYDPNDPFDWANDLIRELAHAKERGVDVTVIIEHRTYWGYMDKNLEAYDYLLAHGITVRLDDEKDTDHMKLVIIDDNIVYVGSHNWSESALHHNRETSVKIVSENIAEIFKAYFETI